MFDQNGIWRDETYGAPGPSGGATGALDLMNVMQSGQNYNQEHAAKMAFLLSKILADKNAGALMQTPYAAQATEMSPEDIQSAYANTPEMRFQNLYGQMTPDQQTDPEAMMRAGIMSGAEQPNAGLAASLKMQESYRKSESNANTNWTRILDQARKAIASRSNPQEGAKVAESLIRNGGAQLGIPDEDIEKAVQVTIGATAGMGIDPKTQAQIDSMKSMSDYRQMQTNLLPAETAAKIRRLDAMTGLATVEATLKQIDQTYAAKGEISPQARAKMLMQLNIAMANMSARGPGLADALAAGDPNTQALFRQRINLGLKTLANYANKLDTGAPEPSHGGAAATVVATGKEKGTNRKVEKLSDGTVRYADAQ